jgi:hypothetical protein
LPATSTALASESVAGPRTGAGTSAGFGAGSCEERPARIEPATAIPNAPPISRDVSFTAEATPCFSSGTALTIAEVVGAVHIPMPVASTNVGQANWEYVECRSSPYLHAKPMAMNSVPTNSTSPPPEFDDGDDRTRDQATPDR